MYHSALAGASHEEGESLKKGVELGKSSSDKHIDLLRPTARYYSMFKGPYFRFCFVVTGSVVQLKLFGMTN